MDEGRAVGKLPGAGAESCAAVWRYYGCWMRTRPDHWRVRIRTGAVRDVDTCASLAWDSIGVCVVRDVARPEGAPG
jgi:hypothetical protein